MPSRHHHRRRHRKKRSPESYWQTLPYEYGTPQREFELDIHTVAGYFREEEIQRYRDKGYYCQQFMRGGMVYKIFARWEAEERAGMGAAEKEQRDYAERKRKLQERRKQLMELKKRQQEREQRLKERLERREKRRQEREERLARGEEVSSEEESEDEDDEDDPLNNIYDDVEIGALKDSNVDLGDDALELGGAELLEIQMEEMMDEWGEHLPKIIYLQTRFRSYLARKQLRILREEHRARELNINPPFGTAVNLENIKLGSRVQRGNWPDKEEWEGWPESWDMDGGPHIDGWGGLGTIIGWRNIIGEVTGKDPGHALYAAVRWDNQGPGATGWYRAAIGAQGDLGAGGKPMFHLCHSTGLPHEKLSDLNVEIGARVYRGPRWVVSCNDAEQDTREGELNVKQCEAELKAADKHLALRLAAEKQAPAYLMSDFVKKRKKAARRVTELRAKLRMLRQKLHRDRQRWDYDGHPRERSHAGGTIVGYRELKHAAIATPDDDDTEASDSDAEVTDTRLARRRSRAVGGASPSSSDPTKSHGESQDPAWCTTWSRSMGGYTAAEGKQKHKMRGAAPPRDRKGWVTVRWDITGILADYSMGADGVYNLYLQEHAGRRQMVLLQPVFRGYLGRLRARKRLKAIIDIQRMYRGMDARREVRRMRGDDSSSDDDSDGDDDDDDDDDD